MTDDTPTAMEPFYQTLVDFGQQHLTAHWKNLSRDQQQTLASQIDKIDFALMTQLFRGDGNSQDWDAIGMRATSPPAFRLSDSDAATASEAKSLAEEALRKGKLAVILVAGGQGTRLGFEHPKGMYEIGPLSNRSLFQMHIEQLRAIGQKFGAKIPLYLMTSPATHDETAQYLHANQRFGLAEEDLKIFCQGTMPAVDAQTGKLLLADQGSIFLSPDGHGGMLSALDKSGCLDDISRRGIEQLFYFQVDNPLVSICDRELLGYHLRAKSEMSSQVVAKTSAEDKVGNVVSVDDRLMVIEYSDLSREAAQRKSSGGNLELWAGSIAVHIFDVAFLKRMLNEPQALPFHQALKAVPYIDLEGRLIEPTRPNAIKFERFIFDLMPAAKNAIVVEAEEERVFAPLKNASGAPKDTPETTRAAIVRESRKLLRQAGATIDDDVEVEVSPLFGLDPSDVKSKINPDLKITSPTYFQL